LRSSRKPFPVTVWRPHRSRRNLIKRIERIAFGLTVFRHYRICALLYAGRPNWDLLATITPR
jgi:transposase